MEKLLECFTELHTTTERNMKKWNNEGEKRILRVEMREVTGWSGDCTRKDRKMITRSQTVEMTRVQIVDLIALLVKTP